MNKYRLNLIVRTLTLPFVEKSFLSREKDHIFSLAQAYYDACYTEITSLNQRKKYEKRYDTAKRNLNKYIRNSNQLRARTIDDVMLMIQLFYPETEIAKYIYRYSEYSSDKEAIVSSYYIDRLFDMAVSLLTFRDGRIAIRTWINKKDRSGKGDLFDYHDTFDKVEIWNTISRMIVPDVLIAAFFVESGLRDRQYLYGQNGGIFLADKTLEKVLEHGIAETHMHFNVGLNYVVLWQLLTDPKNWEGYFSKRHKWNFDISPVLIFRCVIFRLCFAAYMEEICKKGGRESLWQFLERDEEFRDTLYEIIDSLDRGNDQGDLEMYREFYYKLHRRIRTCCCDITLNHDFLAQTVYRMDEYLNTNSEMIFLNEFLWRIRERRDIREQRLFVQYLRVKNYYYNLIIQDNSILGLDFFQTYYGKAREASVFGQLENVSVMCREIFKSQSHNINLRKLEIRMSLPLRIDTNVLAKEYDAIKRGEKKRILKVIENVLGEYIQYCRNMLNISETEQINEEKYKELDLMYDEKRGGFPSIGIVFNIRKVDYLDNRIGDMCWVRYTQKDTNPFFSKHLIVWRKNLIHMVRCIEELRSEIPYLAEYLVGLDAASNECSTEPWILAPIYKEIRNRNITKPLLFSDSNSFLPIQNIGFTYHVGEEFRHILSGLRHIDEILEYFQYKAGDRLGHAIALGEKIELWANNNEVVTIPAMEHLENLLWLWGNIVYGKMDIQVMMEELEGRIMVAAESIYGNTQGMTPHMMYAAYQEKFNRNHEHIFKYCAENLISDTPKMKNRNHFCFLHDENKEIFWTKEKLICTYYCPNHYANYQRPIFVPIHKGEIALYQNIQKHMIKKVETSGVFVETNPTSNVAIGEANGLFEHYSMKLNSIPSCSEEEKNEVLVTINSDDPVVFNTNAENELAYIYHALVHQGYKKEEILKWMDKIRQYGLDSSFIRKEKKPSVQIKEIEIIMQHIKKYYKQKHD